MTLTGKYRLTILFAAVAAVAALSALFLSLTGAPAQAQGAQTTALVSNIGKANSSPGHLGDFDHAQGFTTGGDSDGYTLTSVGIEFGQVADASIAYAVSIRTNNSGSPGNSIGSLTGPATLAANALNTFTTSGIDLMANTTYFVMVNSSSYSDNQLRHTSSDAEDSGGASGWTIGDTTLYRALSGGAWSPFSETKKIRINGTVTGADVPITVTVAETLSTLEDDGGAEIVVTAITGIDAQPPRPFEIILKTTDGTAAQFDDYVPLNSLIRFNVNDFSATEIDGVPRWQAEKTTVVPIVVDDDIEANETFTAELERTVSLSPAIMLGTPNTITITILNDDGTVSIAADTVGVREGETAAFTLSRTGSTTAALTVEVEVTQEGNYIDGTPPTSVTFAVGDADVALEIPTVNDEVGEDNGSITVTITSVPSGSEISQTAGSATMKAVDKGDVRATVSMDQKPVTVKESDGTVMVKVVARMEPNVTPFEITVSLSTSARTARFGQDYESITAATTFSEANFTEEADGRWVAHEMRDVTIYNNHAGRWEGDEQFVVKLERSPTLPAPVIFVDGDGNKVSRPEVTITITDNDPKPSLDLSVTPPFVEKGDTATVKVTSTNGSAFAEDQTIALSFSGAAVRGADYTVGDDTLTLGAGLTEVTTTIEVLDDGIADDAGETIVIEAAHGGTSFSKTSTLVISGLAPPTMLPVTPGDGRVKVCFDAVGGTRHTVQWRSDSQAFRIARQKTVFETSETMDCGPGTVSTALWDLDNGTTYWFRAQSTQEWQDDQKGHQSEVSDWSDAVSGTPKAVPAVPANVVLTPGNTQLKVDWDPVAGADGYSVEWRQNDYFQELDATTNSATITGLQNGRSYGVRVLAENVSGRSAWSAVARGAPGQPTASFRSVPAAHDGQNAVSFQVAFSHEMGSDEQSLRDDSFTVNDGDVTETRRVDGSNTLWEITVQPDSREDMTIILPDRDCGEAGAVCTDEDTPRSLTNSPSATVKGLPASEGDPSSEPAPNSLATGAPIISGTAQVGETLMADTSGIADADGTDDATFAYQWIAGDSDIDGATGSSYTLTYSEQGQTI